MFDDLFDFAKQRTLKQSVGFYIFYGSIIGAVTVVMKAAGL